MTGYDLLPVAASADVDARIASATTALAEKIQRGIPPVLAEQVAALVASRLWNRSEYAQVRTAQAIIAIIEVGHAAQREST